MEREQGDEQGGQGHPGDQVGHPLAESGICPVAQTADIRLEKKGDVIVQRHEETDDGDAGNERFQKIRDEGVIKAPGQADAEKSEAEPPGFFHSRSSLKSCN